MRALATLALLAASAAAADPEVAGGAVSAEVATSISTAAPADATPGSAGAATSSATPDAPAVRKPAVAPTQALVDKMGQGDRLFLAGDHRGALFAYQDAVYLQPRYAPARVRLGRAYLSLRYPEQAIAQAEAALAEDPDSAEARKLLEDARAAPPRPKPGTTAGVEPAAPAAAGGAKGSPRVFKLTAEPEPKVAPRAAAGQPAAPAPAAGPSTAATPVPVASAVPSPGVPPSSGRIAVPVPVAVAATPPGPSEGARRPEASPAAESARQPQVAAQHYRTALGLLQARDWAKAVAALSDAILADPTLAVAYSARGSAQFGLGKYRDAAEDYAAAIRLDAKLGTPVYGLAECYRVLGDGKRAAEMYERYAGSAAPDVRDDLRALAIKRAKELR